MPPPLHHVVPMPANVSMQSTRWFTLPAEAQILVEPSTPQVVEVAEHLAAVLRPPTGYALPIAAPVAGVPRGSIRMRLDPSGPAAGGDEAYTLDITDTSVLLVARHPSGLFRGIQTLRQLFPASIEARTRERGPWRLRLARIEDAPRFAWRGAMLDVSRHFFDVDDVKRYIDLLAKYKLNVLHLHLSDDQGWRIEIASWPRLTEYGSTSSVNDERGGFYTQAQYREIVAYAASRYITIVPEIDMPGHTNAALASYPELNCDGVAPPLYTGIKVGFSTLCVDKEITYTFVDDVVRELAALTPGPWIHLGGDEVEKLTDEQYARFVERVQDIVAKHGKQMVGWEEITKARLAPTTLVQQWRGGGEKATAAAAAVAAEAVRQGTRLIMSPASRVYLDMKYDATTALGLNWAGFVEVRDAYDWDPVTLYPGIAERDVLGVEAPLWSETLVTIRDVEQMAFPRIAGVAEIGWSPAEWRRFDEFRQRLALHGPRWERLGVHYYRSPQVPWPREE